jgi:hypothetical protein
MNCRRLAYAILLLLTAAVAGGSQEPAPALAFELVQPELFGDAGGQPTAWADVDADGDGRPDLYAGAFLAPEPHYRDWLYLNRGSANALRFVEALR